MMPRLVLHIGSHKTATTLVQRWLLANVDELRARGVDYPNLKDVVPTAVDFTQWDLFAALAAGEQASRLGEGGLEPVLDRLRSSQSDLMVLSAENCWGLPGNQSEDYFGDKADFVARTVETLRRVTGRDVEVVAWLRRPDQYLLSLFNQTVKQLPWSSESVGLSDQFADFVDQHRHLAQYDRHLALWERHIGPASVTLRQFAPAAMVDGDPVGDFAHVVGIDQTGLEAPAAARTNEAWSALALTVKGEVNRSIRSREASMKARRLIESVLGPDTFSRDAAPLAAVGNVSRLQKELAGELTRTRQRLGDPADWNADWESDIPGDDLDTEVLVRLAAGLVLRHIRRPPE